MTNNTQNLITLFKTQSNYIKYQTNLIKKLYNQNNYQILINSIQCYKNELQFMKWDYTDHGTN